MSLLLLVEAWQDGRYKKGDDTDTGASDDPSIEGKPWEETETGRAPDANQQQGVSDHLGCQERDNEREGKIGIKQKRMDNVAK